MEVVGNRWEVRLLRLVRDPYASLRWHYPDQVQRVFLTHATRTSSSALRRTPALAAHTIHRPPAVWQPV
ncbi:hypothetical protein QFZ96_003487 [Paraburkholderia youngii]